jgi:cation-transporting ATPase 13A1
MAEPPHEVQVYRQNQWVTMLSDKLLPGDLVSIVRLPSEDISLPCDVLLLTGHCIVNEAMLSGESTPLVKESATTMDKDLIVSLADQSTDIHNDDGTSRANVKNALLYGGTRVLQHTPEPSDLKVSDPPNGGCIGYVLRSGFGTTQGCVAFTVCVMIRSLVRAMLFATRTTAASAESLLFILFLTFFAMIASLNVWYTGLANDRPRRKLLLECIMILTSAVPPELPMECVFFIVSSTNCA